MPCFGMPHMPGAAFLCYSDAAECGPFPVPRARALQQGFSWRFCC